MPENFADNAQTTLASPVASPTTTLTVTDATGFPLAPFRVRLGDELLLVTNKSGTGNTTWTLSAATATNHADGDTVTQILAAEALTSLFATALPTGTILDFASPVAPTGYLKCDGTAVLRSAYPDLFALLCPQYAGATTNASPSVTITGTDAGSKLAVGMKVSGTGIQANTTVTAVSTGGGNTSLTLSLAATATGSPSLTFHSWGVGDGSTTFNVPDLRRRVAMGAAGTAVQGPANIVGSTGGSESHTLVTSEMPVHSHDARNRSGASGGGVTGWTGVTNDTSTGLTTGTAGGSGGVTQPHNNVQPSAVVLKVIKT